MGYAPVESASKILASAGEAKARRAGLRAALRALRFPCAARIPRSIVASQEHVALIVDQRN